MTPFILAEPRSLDEALSLLDTSDSTVRPVAGGTALMLMMKTGVFRPTKLVSLRHIEARHARAVVDGEGALRIGAMATLSAIEASSVVHTGWPVITETLRTLSNVRVRNVATIGGHLAHADPHMDLPPVLIALGARVTIVGPGRERTIPVQELFTGYYETALAADELIAEVVVPPQSHRRSAYLKCTTRAVHDWPALGVAVSLPAYGEEVSVVLSAATAAPFRALEAEIILSGARDDVSIACAAEAAAQAAPVESDARGSAAYKRQLVRVFVTRAVQRAIAVGGEA